MDRCSWFVLENGKADLYGVENYETVFEYPEQLLDYNGLKVKACASDNRKMQ